MLVNAFEYICELALVIRNVRYYRHSICFGEEMEFHWFELTSLFVSVPYFSNYLSCELKNQKASFCFSSNINIDFSD